MLLITAQPIRNLRTPASADMNKRGFLEQASPLPLPNPPPLFPFLPIPYPYPFRRLLSRLEKNQHFLEFAIFKWLNRAHQELCLKKRCQDKMFFLCRLMQHKHFFYANYFNRSLTSPVILDYRGVTKISSCWVFIFSSRGSRKQSWTPLPPRSFWSATSTIFQKALPPQKSNLHQEYSYH